MIVLVSWFAMKAQAEVVHSCHHKMCPIFGHPPPLDTQWNTGAKQFAGFFSLLSIVQPRLLFSMGSFMTELGNPILGGQQPSASVDDHTAAETQAQRLLQLTSDFILRRSHSLLALPPRTSIMRSARSLVTKHHCIGMFWDSCRDLSLFQHCAGCKQLQRILFWQ